MNQNTARGLILAGLSTFLLTFGADVAAAHTWAEITQPAFVGKALIQLGGVGVALFGALKVKA